MNYIRHSHEKNASQHTLLSKKANDKTTEYDLVLINVWIYLQRRRGNLMLKFDVTTILKWLCPIVGFEGCNSYINSSCIT